MRKSKVEFIREQGFPAAAANDRLYSALMLQPRIVGGVVALGIVLQSPQLFLALSAMLWWSTLVPTRSIFDAIYNHTVAYPRNLPLLGVAPAPRRFAQGMAGSIALAIGGALLFGATITAWLLEGVFVVASLKAVFGNSCFGAYAYHVLRRLIIARPAWCRVWLPRASRRAVPIEADRAAREAGS
jgi:Domain of unknown function (DUF4395)